MHHKKAMSHMKKAMDHMMKHHDGMEHSGKKRIHKMATSVEDSGPSVMKAQKAARSVGLSHSIYGKKHHSRKK